MSYWSEQELELATETILGNPDLSINKQTNLYRDVSGSTRTWTACQQKIICLRETLKARHHDLNRIASEIDP